MELNAQNSAKNGEKVVKFREREKWDRKIEFILSTVGFAVGLGNVWRFPYLCYKNGGGAFLIPYFVCLIAGGIPVFFLEIGIGQLTSQGGITVWETISPLYKGIGYASAIICFLLNIYYIVILAWAIHYFIASFTWDLPWATCGHSWNTKNCLDFSANGTAHADAGNRTISLIHSINGTNHSHMKDAAVEYWENRVLGVSSGIDEIGGIRWELAGTLLISWIAVYFCIWKGVKSTGKVVYFTATFPYVMMTILLIRGVTLDGAWDGIQFYLTPNFGMLWKGQVWIDAGTQIFFSYATAIGCMTALGSYNHYKHNFIRDCTFIACINSMTSLYAGFVIFSVLGFMAKEQGVSIDQVAESGPGLAFIVYPKAVAQMPGSPFWSVLFFLMIMLIGLDSQFVGVEGFVTAIVDVYPKILRVGYRREYFIAGVSLVSYLIGLSMVTNGGIYIFQLFDYYAASGMTLLWVSFVECIAVAWIYGVGKFCDDIKDMVGFKPSFWLAICWTYLTPILTMGILLYSIIYYEPLTYNKTYKYPRWAQGFGWMLALSSMIAIPIYFMYHHTRKALQDGDKNKRISETEMNEIKPVEMINGDGHI